MEGRQLRPGAKSTVKRQQILDAAAKTLAESGYSDMTLTDIAREVGTHAGSLYYYFPSREDLVREVFITSLNRMAAEFFEVSKENSHLSPLDRVLALVRLMLARRTGARDDYLRAYMRNGNQVPEAMRRELKTIRNRMHRTLAGLVRDAQAANQVPPGIDPTVAALFIVGAANWVALWYDPNGPKAADEITESFIDLLLNGLLGIQGAPSAVPAPVKPAPKKRRARRA